MRFRGRICRRVHVGSCDQVRDVAVLTFRNLIHIAREPLRLSDVTVQPVLFTLLFVYVIGAGVALPGGGSYTDYAIAGLLALNLTTSALGTAVGLSDDLGSGVIDRFRTLPMWRSAILVGRSVADLLTAAICTMFVVLTGLVVGWRPDAHVWRPCSAGLGLFLLFSYAISWFCACLGIVSKERRVRTGDRSGDLVSAGDRLERPGPHPAHAGAAPNDRQLEPGQRGHGRRPRSCSATRIRRPRSSVWPMQHPVLATLIWSVALIALVRAAGGAPLSPADDRLSSAPLAASARP